VASCSVSDNSGDGRALRIIFPSWWSDESTLVVIDVGIDESKSGSLLVVSAIVGKTSPMRKLHISWKSELTEAGIDYFHAKEHWNLKSKAYHGINKRRFRLFSGFRD
jgi:hypothetical protein